jgi:hypothetical protein
MLEGHRVAGCGEDYYHPNKHRQPVFDECAELRHGAWNQSSPGRRNANSRLRNGTAHPDAEAIEAEKAGLKVKFKTNPEPVPEEFQNKLAEIPALKAAFAALTPGRQRGYILYFSRAKQSKTRESRVDKCMRQILDGKGLNE